MIRQVILIVLTCACINLQAQVNIITTVCGNGNSSFSGDGGLAASAELYFPSGLCLDQLDNIYIADGFNDRIRRINLTSGIITTVAGINGGPGYNGDNIPATNARLHTPVSVFCDSFGNVYIAEAGNNRIRKITVATGMITTIAGTGYAGYSGDGNLATNAQLNAPGGVAVDKHQNILISDYRNHRIRKVEANSQRIFTIAGTGSIGYSGDGLLATNAQINSPGQAIADSAGNVFFTEVGNAILRKVNVSDGIIYTIAGNGTAGYSGDGGPAVAAKLNGPYGIFLDAFNNIYFAEWGNGIIRKINAQTGIITTEVGCGITGFSGDGGSATDAKLQPNGVWVDKFGTIFIADMDNNRIRKVFNPQLSINTPSVNNKVSVYPNPANNEITIEYSFSSNENAILQITDIEGRVVSTKTLQSNKQKEEINIHALPQGLYLYRVLQENTLISTGKIIKQ